MKTIPAAIKLDWTKLFGFNQVKAAQGSRAADSSAALIACKIGSKCGTKGGGSGSESGGAIITTPV